MTSNDDLLQASDLLTHALALRRERHYAEALGRCEAALSVAPQDRRARDLHAKLNKLRLAFDLLGGPAAQRATPEAIRCLEEALAMQPLEPEMAFGEVLQAEREALQGGLAQAKRDLARSLSQAAIKRFREANGVERRPAYVEAETKLRQASELDPLGKAAIEADLAAVRERLQPLQEADEYVVSGKKALQAGDYETALHHFDAALARDEFHRAAADGQSEARDRLDWQREMGRGEATFTKREYGKAVRHFEMAQSIARKYDDLGARVEGRLTEARRQLEAQGSYEGALAAAKEAMARQDFDAAIQQFGQALTQRPGDRLAQAGLKQAEDERALLSEMTTRVREALAQEPPNLGQAKLYGRETYARFGRQLGAQALWQEVLLTSGKQLLAEGRYGQAAEEFGLLLEQFPDHAEAAARRQEADARQQVAVLRARGQECLTAGQYAEAERYFGQALEAAQGYNDLAGELQVLVKQARGAGEARDKLAFLTEQARYARDQRRWDEVMSACEQALKVDPTTSVRGWLDEARQRQIEVEGLRERSQEALAQGAPESAVQALAQAQQIWPGHATISGELAGAYIAWGEQLLDAARWPQAVEAFEKARLLAPEEEQAVVGLRAARELPQIRRLLSQAEEALQGGQAEAALAPLRDAQPLAQRYPVDQAQVAEVQGRVTAAIERSRLFGEAQTAAATAGERGDLAEQIRWLEEAQRQAPGDATTEEQLGKVRRDQATFAQAWAVGQTALEQARAAYAAGHDNDALVQLRDAATQFRAALGLALGSQAVLAASNEVRSLEARITLVKEAGSQRATDLEGAVGLLEEAARQYPDDSRLADLLREYSAEREEHRRAEAVRLSQQADSAWDAGQLLMARELYGRVWQLTGDVAAKARADQVEAMEQQRRAVQQLADEGETQLRQVDYARAERSFESALRRLFNEGDVDEQAAALVKQANAADLVQQLNDARTQDAAWQQVQDCLTQAEARRRAGGRDTGMLLDVAGRLAEARQRRAVAGQVQSAKAEGEREAAVERARQAVNLDPGNEVLIAQLTACLTDLRTYQDGRAARRVELADVRSGRGDYAGALAYLREAAGLSGLSAGLQQELESRVHQVETQQQIADQVLPLIQAAKECLDGEQYDQALAVLAKARLEIPEKQAASEARQVEQLLATAQERRRAALEQQVAGMLGTARALLSKARDRQGLDAALEKAREAEALLPDHARAQDLVKAIQERSQAWQQVAELKTDAASETDPDAAIALWQKVLAVEPGDSMAIAALSRAQKHKGLADRKHELKTQGNAALAQEDYGMAVTSFSALFGLDPADSEVPRLLRQAKIAQAIHEGQEYLDAGENEAALRAFRRADSLWPEDAPDHPKITAGLEQASQRIERFQAAEQLAAQARVALATRDYSSALDDLGQALSYVTDHQEALALRGEVQVAQRKAANAEPDLQNARFALERADYAAALRYCDQALAADPGSPQALVLRQQAESGQNRMNQLGNVVAKVQQALQDDDYAAGREYLDRLRESAPDHRDLEPLTQQLRKGESELQDWQDRLALMRFHVEHRLPEQLGETIAELEKAAQEAPRTLRDEIQLQLGEARTRKATAERLTQALGEARKLYEAGRYAEALALLERMPALLHEQYEVVQLREEIGIKQRRQHDADALLTEAQKLAAVRTYPQALDKCGQARALAPNYLRVKEVEDSISEAQRKAIKAIGFLAEARAVLKAMQSADDPERAVKLVEQALELDPTQPEGLTLQQAVLEHQARAGQLRQHLEAGRIALRDKSYDKAVAEFAAVLALDRNNEEAAQARTGAERDRSRTSEVARLVKLGYEHLSVPAHDKALESFQKALAIGPDDPKPAQAGLEQARLGLEGERIDALLQQARLHCEEGAYEKAQNALDQVRQVRPASTDAARLDAFIHLLKRGEAASAHSEYREALSEYGEAQALYRKEGLAPPASRRLSELQSAARDGLGLPQRLKKAQDHLETDEYDRSAALARELLSADPTYAQAQDFVQTLVTRLCAKARDAHGGDNYSQALAFCDQALTLAPGDETANKLRRTIVEDISRLARQHADAAGEALSEDDLARAKDAVERGLCSAPEDGRLLALQSEVAERQQMRHEADALIRRGREAWRMGRREDASRDFEAAVARDHRHRQAPLWRQFAAWLIESQQHLAAERYDEVTALCERAVKPFPAEAAQWPEIAEARRLQEDARARDTIIQQMVGLLAEAQRLRAAGDYQAARQALEQLLGLRFPGETLPSA